MARRLLILLALAGACRNATASDEAPARAEPKKTPYTDERRFAAQLEAGTKRWSGVEPPADCAELLPENARESCARVRAALANFKQTLPSGSPNAVIQKSGALALAAERAAEKLRQNGLKELFSDSAGAASAAPSSKGLGPPAAPGFTPPPAPRAAASTLVAHPHAIEPVQTHTNPTLSAILEHARLSSLALRQLAIYLEQGPRELRAEAVRELVRLGREEPRWKNLESISQEARFTETDPELRRELDKLLTHLRAERGVGR